MPPNPPNTLTIYPSESTERACRTHWHSSGSYSKPLQIGGSNGGTMRSNKESSHGGNAGLDGGAIQWMAAIKRQNNDVSYGDLYTLAGVVAIEAMGGLVIKWRAGRVAVTPDDRLPNDDSGPPGVNPTDAKHLRDVFGRMGFTDQDIVALSGALAVRRCHKSAK